MKKQHILILCFMVLACGTASAQFKKALPNSSPTGQSEARLNIGLVGGPNYTLWQHFNSAQTSDWYVISYKPEFDFGYFGGIALEYMLKPNSSIGLNVVYAQHNMKIGYLNDHFPIGFNQYDTLRYSLSANYRSIEAYVPLTYYVSVGSKTMRPYIYVAPHVSYILDGTMTYLKTTETDTTAFSTTTFNDSTFRKINVGAMVGVGTQFNISVGNYYFLTKIDASVNLNLLNTFTAIDLENEFNFQRYCAGAQISVYFMLPIKKQLQGACMKWGEYD